MRFRNIVRLLIIVGCILGITSTTSAEKQIYVPRNEPFPIAQVALNSEYDPTIAYDFIKQQYLVSFVNELGGSYAVNAVCLDKEGTIIQTYVLGNGLSPDAVYNPSNDTYIVVWEYSTTGNIGGARVSGNCCPQVGCTSAPWNVTYDRPGYEGTPAIAYNEHASHEDMLIVWADDENQSSHWAVWGRRLSGTTFMGSSFPITSTTTAHNYQPDVAYNLNMNEFIVVYTTDSSKGMNQTTRDINARRLWNGAGSTGGLLAESAIDTSGGSQDSPAVATYRLNHNTPYLVIFRDHWNDNAGDIRGYLLNKDHAMPMQLLNIATRSGIPEDTPKISSFEPRGGYAVVWTESLSGSNSNVLWRKVSPEGLMGNTIGVATTPVTNWYPDIANSLPFPLAVWVTNDGTGNDVFARFLYVETYLPAVMRNP